MSEHKPSDELTHFVNEYLGGCPECAKLEQLNTAFSHELKTYTELNTKQAEQIKRLESDNLQIGVMRQSIDNLDGLVAEKDKEIERLTKENKRLQAKLESVCSEHFTD